MQKLLLMTTLLAACGGGRVIRASEAPKEATKPTAPDTFRDFRGPHVAVGQPFTLRGDPVAVDGPRVLVQLARVSTRTWETAPGKSTSEGTAELTVTSAAETRTVRIVEGESKDVLGARIAVKRAVTEYVKEALEYLPVADLVVEAAP
jgi:hypothetical protein